MPETTKPRPLTMTPCPSDENGFEQLVAAVARIEKGLGDMVDALSGGPQTRDRIAALAIAEPEPEWLTAMRARYRDARQFGAQTVVVPREAIANLLTLIDLARDGARK